ncbi:hypothetical protein WR25_11307 [Diploscapter pachys]|uniref:Tyrosine specific protein phosphatases domain-containing protein n=1 Tax=Diploscapter pachys TaxID=2018661 RepID=A0A2A2K7P0_9BILA|nr:hypothetical protein WR25_11307 [Diploscapter pachys]
MCRPGRPLPWQQARLARDPKRWRLALRYGLGALLLAVLGFKLGHSALWLLWPAFSLLLVALNYALFGAQGFQKDSDGRLSVAATALLAPYLIAAWINSRLWTWRHPQADEVCEGVYLGRVPGAGDAVQFQAVIDLSAELACRALIAGQARCHEQTPQASQSYLNLPSLDLVAPDTQTLQQAAEAIEHLRRHGPVLVCCALGYSRSASAVAAWLVVSGRCKAIAHAETLIRQARPGVYWAIRVALDAELFARLASRDSLPADTQALDRALFELRLKPTADDPRGWPARSEAALALLRRQALCLAAQVLLAVTLPFTG